MRSTFQDQLAAERACRPGVPRSRSVSASRVHGALTESSKTHADHKVKLRKPAGRRLSPRHSKKVLKQDDSRVYLPGDGGPKLRTVTQTTRAGLPAGAVILKGQGVYFGEHTDGWREGHGRLCYFGSEYLSYEGGWKDDVMHGDGTLVMRSGAIYKGTFHQGTRHGTGSLTFPNGDKYCGEWREDTKEGDGIFLWAQQGTSYEGSFCNGTMHGRGVYTFADSSIFEGQYENGERKGHGVLTLADGTRESGEWHGSNRLPSKKERNETAVATAPPPFRPDLVLQRQQSFTNDVKQHLETVLAIEAKVESLRLEAICEADPTGADWDALSSA